MFLSNHMIILLFAVGTYAGTLPTVQIKNGSEIIEIEERPNIIEIIEPKVKPGVEREMLIVEIIEKPCRNTAEKKKVCKEDGPDLDETVRPFTNGHGYQFVVFGPKYEDKSIEENEKIKANSDDKQSKEEKENKEDENNDSIEGKKDSNQDNDDVEVKKEEKASKVQKDSNGNTEDIPDSKNEASSDEGKKDVNDDKKDIIEIKIPSDDGKKDREDSKSPQTRRKRDLYGNPPPPPVLPPMDVNMFPSFIRNMISTIPVLQNMVAETDAERPDQDAPQPRTYGFHLDNDRASVFNNLNGMQYNTGNQLNKNSDRIEPTYTPDDSKIESDDDSENDDDDGNDEENQGYDEDYSDRGYGTNAPTNGINSYKPITKDQDLGTENKNFEDWKKNKPIIEKIVYLTPEPEKKYKMIKNDVPISKPRINIKEDLKDKIEMTFNKARDVVPPKVRNYEGDVAEHALEGTPNTYGMRLVGDHGYVWNDLNDPSSHYSIGEPIEIKEDVHASKVIKVEPDPTPADFITTSRPYEEVTTEKNEVTTEISPVTENIDRNKENVDDNNDAVKEALDNLMKKDEFWKWLTKWTAAYIEVLNEHIERLVKKEVAKQIHKLTDEKIKKEKEKNATVDGNLNENNKTAANNTVAEPNKTDANIPIQANNTIIPEKEVISNDSNVHTNKPNVNSHTIYGNAVDSNHVTNIFIFYPKTENATNKDLETILNKTNNAVVLGQPPSGNDEKTTAAPPTDATTEVYSIDKKKEPVNESTTTTSPTTDANSTQISNGTAANNTSVNNETTTSKADNSSATTPAPKADNSSATTPAPKADNSSATTPAPKVDDSSATTPAPKVDDSSATTPAPKVDDSSATTPAPGTSDVSSASPITNGTATVEPAKAIEPDTNTTLATPAAT